MPIGDCSWAILGSLQNLQRYPQNAKRPGSFEDDPISLEAKSYPHDGYLVGNLFGKLHILLDEQDGHAIATRQADHLGKLAHDQRSQTLARLIEECYLGIADQRAGEPAISTPSSSTRPLVGGTSPITARAVVVLPTPLRPGTDTIILGASAR